MSLPYTKKLLIILAGIFINIVTGFIAFKLGMALSSYNLMYFGLISISLGVTNLIPWAACLDGGYAFYLPILVKKYGYEQGLLVFTSWVHTSFKVIMILNILSIPLLIWYALKGML